MLNFESLGYQIQAENVISRGIFHSGQKRKGKGMKLKVDFWGGSKLRDFKTPEKKEGK